MKANHHNPLQVDILSNWLGPSCPGCIELLFQSRTEAGGCASTADIAALVPLITDATSASFSTQCSISCSVPQSWHMSWT